MNKIKCYVYWLWDTWKALQTSKLETAVLGQLFLMKKKSNLHPCIEFGEIRISVSTSETLHNIQEAQHKNEKLKMLKKILYGREDQIQPHLCCKLYF